ncbi:hypothetical protein KY285_026481 [Solanum tuberosum]|nr:hypothetical protein KY285_026481 [Solanum tuberosum]
MTHVGIEIEINRNLFFLAKYNYPWLKDLPTSWPGLIKFIKEYTPTLGCRIVVWNPPVMGSFKCNSDGASKGNPGPSYGAFCIKNGERNLFYAEVRRLFDGANIVVENILDGICETPWGIVIEIKRIKMLMEDKEVLKD